MYFFLETVNTGEEEGKWGKIRVTWVGRTMSSNNDTINKSWNFFNSCHTLSILYRCLINYFQLFEEGITVPIIKITELKLRE